MAKDLARDKWLRHGRHCKERGVKPIDLEGYKKKILDAGITPEQIGRTLGCYHLARYADVGDYTESSCRFITLSENLKEKCINGGTARGAEKKRGVPNPKMSLVMTGRNAKTHEYIARCAEKRATEFSLMSQNGAILNGRNLRKFCRENNLDMSGIRRVLHGTQKSYKGWSKVNSLVERPADKLLSPTAATRTVATLWRSKWIISTKK